MNGDPDRASRDGAAFAASVWRRVARAARRFMADRRGDLAALRARAFPSRASVTPRRARHARDAPPDERREGGVVARSAVRIPVHGAAPPCRAPNSHDRLCARPRARVQGRNSVTNDEAKAGSPRSGQAPLSRGQRLRRRYLERVAPSQPPREARAASRASDDATTKEPHPVTNGQGSARADGTRGAGASPEPPASRHDRRGGLSA